MQSDAGARTVFAESEEVVLRPSGGGKFVQDGRFRVCARRLMLTLFSCAVIVRRHA